MGFASLVVVVWTLFGLLGFGFSYSEIWKEAEILPDGASSVTYNYDRIDEVKKECSSVLSSASPLKPEDSRIYSLKQEMGFENGDWNQAEGGKYPIMPFEGGAVEKEFENLDPLKLVSFWVSDIDLAHRSKNFISVSGFMTLGITLANAFGSYGYNGNPQFEMWPGNSQLSIAFEGIYTESAKNGGERVMCLLGTAVLPAREYDGENPWKWAKDSDQRNNPLLQDDRILLVLRYPKTFTLTNRAIRGEMKSLNSKTNEKYFDEVHLSSQLGRSANYEFASERIVSKACDPYPYKNSSLTEGISIYKGFHLCEILDEITRDQGFTVLPNWKCSKEDEFCNKLGPFVADKEIKATNGSFKGVNLYMQIIKCEQKRASLNASSAKVSAVFRAAFNENPYTASRRSGLGNMTVVADGIWNSSSGQLCMVVCPGSVDAQGNGCNSRVCLYIPISFSIQQRSLVSGSFSSINDTTPAFFPLSFEKLVLQPSMLWNYFQASHPYYTYTKIDKAGIILEKNEAFSFGTMFKKSLLKYPKLEDAEAFETSVSLLSEDLTLHAAVIPDQVPNPRPPIIDVSLEILSVGRLFGRYWGRNGSSSIEKEAPYHTKAEYSEKQLLLNVSAQFFLSGKGYENVSLLSLEGLYDQHVGKMYLVGCRDVQVSRKILYESMDLEAGLDCLIEVVVSYPSTKAWLVDSTASISISSQRNEDDPLYFSTVKLKTYPIMYRSQREGIISRRGIEGIFRVLTLSLAIACISSQLFYINHNVDSVPYMSLVMLGVQAIGYSVPLITGAESIFKKASYESYQSYDLQNNQWFQILDYTVKLLVMVSLLLTLRLCQKVWKSRVRLLTRAPLEPHRVPSDKRVLLTTSVIHLLGYITVLIIHSTSQKSIRTKSYRFARANSHVLSEWEAELEEYVGLVQDLFLLPQIIGNLIWQIDCRPLRKLYYVGITLVRLLPHLYDYIRAPSLNPYFAEEYEFVNPNFDFYSKFGDIAIPVTAVVLAVVVYIQQRWNYEKLSQTLVLGQCRLLPTFSRMYERLPSSSKAFEAELTSGVNGNARNERELDEH